MLLFDNEKVFIIKDMNVVLQGIKKHHGLYMIDLEIKPSENMPQLQERHIKNIQATENNVYVIESKEEIIKYYHRCLLCPTIYTWVSAINQGFSPNGLD